MTVLLLKLAGPMQAWGDSSRFARRLTARQPTKSGILGLLAAAQGLRRTDPIEHLLDLKFGVRTDQPGRILSDFQTARSLDGKKTFPLSERFYISDAVFVAGIEGDTSLLQGLSEAIERPMFPLFLGRRSFSPTGNLLLGLRETGLVETLSQEPWHASAMYQNKHSQSGYMAPVSIDAEIATPNTAIGERTEFCRDVPISWNPEKREYAYREVRHYQFPLKESSLAHDPMEFLL